VAAGALGLGNFSALADRSNPRLPWVVSRAGGTYYRNGCGGGARIPPKERLYFRTEGEVQRIGFARATDSQDACDAKALAWHRALIDSAASPVATSVERVESAADSSWVASVADGVYFRRGCSASQDLAPRKPKVFPHRSGRHRRGISPVPNVGLLNNLGTPPQRRPVPDVRGRAVSDTTATRPTADPARVRRATRSYVRWRQLKHAR